MRTIRKKDFFRLIQNYAIIPNTLVGLTPNNTDSTVGELVVRVITYVLPIVGAIALAMIIYGGVLLITSSGDPEKLTKAKQTLLWAIIGIIIVVLSYAIVVSLSQIVNNLI